MGYADDNAGGGFSLTPTTATRYQSVIYVDDLAKVPSLTVADFTTWTTQSGARYITGIGAPANTLGEDGDTYQDPVSQMMYGPKTSGV